ncbi:MAG: hypothetical protein IJU19_05465 [Bacteroidales bacterium]|nr:hypothetical protein [Bacteroidales bacterium]
MKRVFSTLVVAIAAMTMMASCNKDEETTTGGATGVQVSAVSAFFPVGYDRNEVKAWYTGSETQQDGQVNVTAIYIFNNDSLLGTVYKKKADGTERRVVDARGTCTLTSGDYTNGSATVVIPDRNNSFDITISGGVFSERGVTFTKQDNDKVPAAQEPTGEDGDGGQSSGELKTAAYLPVAYGSKTLTAWYAFSNVENDRTKTEAVFLFDDQTLVVTKRKVYSREDGRDPVSEIIAEGTYTLTSGDYENGAADVVAGNNQFSVTITNGILSAMGEQYTKQSNESAPAPSK